MRGRTSFPTLMSPRQALLPTTSCEGKVVHSIFPLSMTPLGRWEWPNQLSHAHTLGGSSLTAPPPPSRVSSAVLPRQDTGPALPSAAGGEGQGKLFHVYDLRNSGARSPILIFLGGSLMTLWTWFTPCQGEVLSPLPWVLQLMRWHFQFSCLLQVMNHQWQMRGTGPGLPLSCSWHHLSHTSADRVSSTVLPRRAVGPAFRSITASERQGQLTHSLDHRAIFPNCIRGQRVRIEDCI